MIKIFLDIENTVLDDIQNAEFMCDNCNRIKMFIQGIKNDLLTVNFFTWGWKTKDEIEPEVVKLMFDRLGIEEKYRGDVFVKEDSVDLMIKQGFLKEEDRAEALIPGAMMNEFGLTKTECFHRMAEKFIPGTKAILIDDLVEDIEADELDGDRSIAKINPSFIGTDDGDC